MNKFKNDFHELLDLGNLVWMRLKREADDSYTLKDVNVFRHATSRLLSPMQLQNYVMRMCIKLGINTPDVSKYTHKVNDKGGFIAIQGSDYVLYFCFHENKEQDCVHCNSSAKDSYFLVTGDHPSECFCEQCFFEKNNIKIDDALQ